jgi:hypothetical protein
MISGRLIAFLAIVLGALGGCLLVWVRAGRSQQPAQSSQTNQKTPTIDEYQPKSTLVTKEHKIDRAKFPFIDIHSHHWNPTA